MYVANVLATDIYPSLLSPGRHLPSPTMNVNITFISSTCPAVRQTVINDAAIVVSYVVIFLTSTNSMIVIIIIILIIVCKKQDHHEQIEKYR